MTGNTGIKWYHSEQLKVVAAASMLIDHIGAVLIENTVLYENVNWTIAAVICRLIGRIAFPLFCFLLVEGFIHTSNIKKYIARIGLFTLISEVPFDLALFGRITLYRQNVFFTLFIGLLMLLAVHKVEQRARPYIQRDYSRADCSIGLWFVLFPADRLLLHGNSVDCRTIFPGAVTPKRNV